MRLKGIYVPIVTPFDEDENINFPVYKQLIEFLIENRIAGFVPGGTTGEVYALCSWRAQTLVLRGKWSGFRSRPKRWVMML